MTRDPNINQARVWRSGQCVIDLAGVLSVTPITSSECVKIRFNNGLVAELNLDGDRRKHLADAFEAYLLGYR